MTVADLKEQLKDLNDDLRIVRSGGDHEYFEIDYAHEVTAEVSKRGEFWEYYDDECMHKDHSKIRVFIIG